MADPFVAEIRVFPFNFAPKGWAFCDGQLLPLSQNTALFSLLGTTYGGNGKSNFALPDLQGRAPLHHGRGPGLSEYRLGETGGAAAVALTEAELPAHAHEITLTELRAVSGEGSSTQPGGRAWATAARETPYASAANTNMAADAALVVLESGLGMPHDNMPPYLTLNFCIALQGVFPPRG